MLPWCNARHLRCSLVVLTRSCSTEAGLKGKRLTRAEIEPSKEFAEGPLRGNHRRRLLPSGTIEASTRVAGLASKALLTRRNLSALVLSSLLIDAIASYEGSLLVNPELLGTVPSLKFIASYGAHNVLASCVWMTKPAEVVAQSLDLDPIFLLRQLGSSPADAALSLKVEGAHILRSVIAHIAVLSQLLHVYNTIMRSTKLYGIQVLSGNAQMLHTGKHFARVIRLCGKQSDATAVSLKRYGRHILPIVEAEPEKDGLAILSIEQSNRNLIKSISGNGRIPFYWKIAPGRYGSPDSWAGLKIDDTYFIRSTTGKGILCLEADSTQTEDPLGINRVESDLAIEDAVQAFRRIQGAVQSSGFHQSRALRVYLGNGSSISLLGHGSNYTVRHRFNFLKEFDVLIDARLAVLRALLKWVRRSVDPLASGGRKEFVFHTRSRTYFDFIHGIFREKGYAVLDTVDYSNRRIERTFSKDTKDELDALPHLFYEATTLETVNICESIVGSGYADISRCCVLLDRMEGVDLLRSQGRFTDSEDQETKQKLLAWSQEFGRGFDNGFPGTGEDDSAISTKNVPGANATEQNYTDRHQFHVICTSILYDDLFRQVRMWARLGHDSEEIQAEFDYRFQEVEELVKQDIKSRTQQAKIESSLRER